MPQILITPPTDEIQPGQTLRVPVTVVVDRPIKVRGLHAKFHGAEESKATYTTYNAATKSTQTHTAVTHVDIVKSQYVVSGNEQRGFFANMSDGLATLFGGGEHETWDPGEYPFEVEVQIPADARPSFTGKKCRVFYELSAFIDIPVWRDMKASRSFVLNASPDSLVSQGSVRTRYPEDGNRGLFESLAAPNIGVEAALAERALRVGDSAEGILVVDTPKALRYRSIGVRLIAVEHTHAQGHNDSYTHQSDLIRIAEEGVIEDHYSKEFTVPVDDLGVVTTRGEHFSIDCFVQLEFDVPWAKNPKIRIPCQLV